MCTFKIQEVLYAAGHENVLATHPVTIEITKETTVSRRGNCVIAVSSDKAIDDLNPDFRRNLRKNHAKLKILLEADGVSESLNASGNSKLILAHPTEIVVRKSSFIDGRTLAIGADKAALDLSRQLIEKLKDRSRTVKITLELSLAER